MPGENHWPVTSHWQTLSHNVVSSTYRLGRLRTQTSVFYLIGGVMLSMFTSSVVDDGFMPWSGQTKDYNICICCSSTKFAALRSKNKNLVGSESW
jgi:hypothetical protein